jgi:hypothetical protein
MFNPIKLHTCAIAAVVACSALPIGKVRAAEDILGRVHDRSGDNVHVCFDRNAKLSVGEQFEVVRHSVLTQPKTSAMIKSEKVGVIRIAAIGADQCADAQLVSGSAQSLDWVASTGS